MFRPIAPLMASLLAIHALLGCCWHHGHDEAVCQHAAASSPAAAAREVGDSRAQCGHCDADHAAHTTALADNAGTDGPTHDSDPAESTPEPSQCDDCQGVCTFVRGSKCVQLDALEACGLFDSPASLLAQFNSWSTGPNRFISHPPGVHPPGRLHLVLQVLVI